jgi:phosphoglycolate phosphatase-like HAD superfamily hydrolase
MSLVPVAFGSQVFACGLVIFDKDGTLIDFAHLWADKTAAAVEALVAGTGRGEELRRDLYAILGYDPAANRFDTHSPVLTAPIGKLYTLAAGVLYRHGWGWLDAELRVEQHFAPAMDAAFGPTLIRPTASLPRLFAALAQAGLKLAVLTSDDHAPTAKTLTWLEIDQHIGWVIGADDPYPHKPAPEAIWAICDQAGVVPDQTVMIGDSTTDMVMARRAGVGLCVAVCTGLMDAATLAPHADVVLSSIGAITLV